MMLKEQLERYLNRAEIVCPAGSLEQLYQYAELVLSYNKSLNLISKVSPQAEIIRQIADSSILTRHVALAKGGRLFDLGSGAGLPGIVLKIIQPDIILSSLDSNPRKISFQRVVIRKLQLDNCTCLDCQFQEYYPEKKADYITIKGLGKFKKILSHAKELLRREGKLIFFTADEVPRELRAIEGSPYEQTADISYNLPDYPGNLRLVILRKVE